MANTNNAYISVGTSETLMRAGDPDIKGWILQNTSAVVVAIAFQTPFTFSETICLGPGEKIGIGDFDGRYNGPVFGKVLSGTADVRLLEWGQ